MYVKRNNEARSFNNYCSGKAISVTYSKYVFVALVIQHLMRMCHIVICVLSGCRVSFHFFS
jgi:hypothetical protein